MGWDGTGQDGTGHLCLLCPVEKPSCCLDHCLEVLCSYLGMLEKWRGHCNETLWLWGSYWSILGSQSPGSPMFSLPIASVEIDAGGPGIRVSAEGT